MSGASAVSAIPITIDKLRKGIKPLKGGVNKYKFQNEKLTNKPDAKPEFIFGDEVFEAVNDFIEEIVQKTKTELNDGGLLKYVECILCKELNSQKQQTFEKVSKYRSHLVSHLSSKQIGESGPIPCDECGRKYTSPHSLQHHRLAAHGTKDGRSYRCDLCGFHTSTISKLQRHKSTHMENYDKRTMQCSYCGKRHATAEGLSQHVMKEHLVDKSEALRYICQFCHKEFGKHAKKEAHVIDCHAGKLEWLQKQKKEEEQELQDALLYLEDGHTVENVARSLQLKVKNSERICSTCGTSFTRNTNLHHHVKKYHQDTLQGHEGCYKCNYCERPGFKNLYEREAHTNLCHQSSVPWLKDRFYKRKNIVSIKVNPTLVETALQLEDDVFDRTNYTRNLICFDTTSSLDEHDIVTSKKKKKKDESEVKAEEEKRSLDNSNIAPSKKKIKVEAEMEQADEDVNKTQDHSEISSPKKKKKKNKHRMEDFDGQAEINSSRTPHEEYNRSPTMKDKGMEIEEEKGASSKEKKKNKVEADEKQVDEDVNKTQDHSQISSPKKKKKKNKYRMENSDGQAEINSSRTPLEEYNRSLDDSEIINKTQDHSEISSTKKKKKKNKHRMENSDGQTEINSSKTSLEEGNRSLEKVKRSLDDSEFETSKSKKKKIGSDAISPVMKQILDLTAVPFV